MTYGHLGSPEELYSGEGTVEPLSILSISCGTGWGSGFVPEAEERARPPVIGWLGAAADEQTLTGLKRTMGEPLGAERGLHTLLSASAAGPGCAGERPPLTHSSQHLLKQVVQRETP